MFNIKLTMRLLCCIIFSVFIPQDDFNRRNQLFIPNAANFTWLYSAVATSMVKYKNSRHSITYSSYSCI